MLVIRCRKIWVPPVFLLLLLLLLRFQVLLMIQSLLLLAYAHCLPSLWLDTHHASIKTHSNSSQDCLRIDVFPIRIPPVPESRCALQSGLREIAFFRLFGVDEEGKHRCDSECPAHDERERRRDVVVDQEADYGASKRAEVVYSKEDAGEGTPLLVREEVLHEYTI